MLLSRLLGWFRNHSTAQVFLLEILAVFIGITASLLVDQWREEQADKTMLDNELRVLRFELERSLSNDTQIMNVLPDSLESAVLLAFGNVEQLSDDELQEHFWQACCINLGLGKDFELHATNAALSIPFNETLSLIEATLADLQLFSGLLRSQLGELDIHVDRMLDSANLVRNASSSVSALKDADLTAQIISQFRTTGALDGAYVADAHNLANIRSAMSSPQVKAELRQLVPMLQAVGVFTVSSIQFKRDLIGLIQRHEPGLSIPVTEVGIDGSGTLFDWQTYIAMTQDDNDPKLWRATLDLQDGEIKFRADRAWAVNWGTPVSSGQAEDGGDEWSYGGDIADVFPRGTAVLNGRNIPVRSGRYDITFNTATLEYSFVKTGDKQGE